jgi:hypothetical protein
MDISVTDTSGCKNCIKAFTKRNFQNITFEVKHSIAWNRCLVCDTWNRSKSTKSIVENPERNRWHWRTWLGYENSNKNRDLKGGRGSSDCIFLAQVRDECVSTKVLVIIRVIYNKWNLLKSKVTVSCSREALVCSNKVLYGTVHRWLWQKSEGTRRKLQFVTFVCQLGYWNRGCPITGP